MRIKRILITLLVALMMFSLVAVSSAADETAPSFDLVTGVSSEHAISNGVISNGENGVEFDFVINVKSNPGVDLISMIVKYDTDVLTFVEGSVSSGLFDGENEARAQDNDGAISIALIGYGKTAVDTDLVTLSFALSSEYDGAIEIVVEDLLVYSGVKEVKVNLTETELKVHAYTDSSYKDATCTNPATQNYVCGKCGDTHVIDVAPELGHKWVDATCSAPKTCSVCKETEGEALPHTWVDATCTAPKTCSVCEATEGEANPHNWSDATCTAPKTCPDCGATEGEPTAHIFGDWTQTTAPTVEAEGEETRTCSACSHSETRPVDKLPAPQPDPVEQSGGNGTIAAVIIIIAVIVCACVVVAVVFIKKKKSY